MTSSPQKKTVALLVGTLGVTTMLAFSNVLPLRAQQEPTEEAGQEGQEEAQAPAEGSTAEGAEEGEEGTLTAPPVEDIDDILREEEEIFGAFETYAYDPGERRDPFRSLLVTREAPELKGPRPEGIPGLLIDEVTLIGIVKTPRGYVAQVQAADRQKSYLLHEGEELYDGEVVSIDSNEVVFRQIVRDPTAVKPFRERVKVLNPS